MIAPKRHDRLLAGRYRLVRVLGAGGMGTVWLAYDELLYRQVAVKEVFPPAEMNQSERDMLRQRTLREARTAARLGHPNVVTIYDVVDDDDRPWIVMQLVSARSLREIVEQDGPLPPRHVARVALQVLAALRAAHALGIVHRDVKPGNVLIEADGRAVLADFGIARVQDYSTITTAGVIVGSPSYIAPERARGERGGPESDLWSLGATIYSAVEGRPPYDRTSPLATLMAVVTQDPDPASRSGPLRPVISGLLRRDPARRLGAAEAGFMLSGVAGMNDTETSPLPASADGDAGMVAPGGRLEHAERTQAFHPHLQHPAAPLPEEAAPSYTATTDDPARTPAPGLPGTSAVPSAAGERVPAVSSDGSAKPWTSGAEPRAGIAAGIAEPADGSEEVPREHPQGSGPDIIAGFPALEAPAPAEISKPLAAHPPPAPAGGSPAAVRHRLIPGIGGQSTPAPRPRTEHAARQRPTLMWMAAGILALIAASGVALVTGTPGRHAALAPPRRDRPATSPASSKSAASGSPPSSSGSPAPASHSAEPSSRATVPASEPGTRAQAVPAGYHRYHDPTGFSIAVPDGWAVSHQGIDVYLTSPSQGSFLLIDQTSHPRPDPLTDWRQQEASRIGTYPGYHRIRLEAINYPQAEKAADWEFTYYRNGVSTHVLNRNILASSQHAYALYWSTPQSEWDADFHIFEVFARTFQPARP